MQTRISRAERTAANRAALLDAALTVFLRDGYHGTTVDAIAREAGLTIGALYSRFEGKADVYLALLEARIEERAAQFSDVPTAADDDDIPREFARRWAELMRAETDWTLLAIEFRVHAARDPELGRRYAALHQRALDGLADNIAASLPADREYRREDLRELARSALALGVGAVLARAAEGDEFTDELHAELSIAISDRLLNGGI